MAALMNLDFTLMQTRQPNTLQCVGGVELVQKQNLLLRTIDELIFIGPFPAGPHAVILPEDL